MRRIDHDSLGRLVSAAFEANGVPQRIADIVSRLQVEANLVGHDSHGVTNTEKYINEIQLGHIVPHARLEVLQEGPGTLVVDGNWGFGYAVTSEVIPKIVSKARKNGVCAAI